MGGVPNVLELMPDDLRWSCYNNHKNKVHNKCNVLESSRNFPLTPSLWKNCLPRKPSLVPERLRIATLWVSGLIKTMRWLHRTDVLSVEMDFQTLKAGICVFSSSISRIFKNKIFVSLTIKNQQAHRKKFNRETSAKLDCGNNSAIYIKSLCCALSTYTVFYVNYVNKTGRGKRQGSPLKRANFAGNSWVKLAPPPPYSSIPNS